MPEQISRANFSKAVNDTLFGSGQVSAVYNSWDDLLTTLVRQARDERLVVVLDEFPYLVAAYPPLASILQRIWDQFLKNSRIMLILNGSYIGMMEETVLGYKAPLYGRWTAQYLLEPLEFLDAHVPGGIAKIDRAVAHITTVPVPALRVRRFWHEGVGLGHVVKIRGVEPCLIVHQARVGQRALEGIQYFIFEKWSP